MTQYKVIKIEGTKKTKDASGKTVSASALVQLYAPTRKADNWTSYIGELKVTKDGRSSFTITHLNSSAWGNSAWRTAPIGYERPDVTHFIKKECAVAIQNLKNSLDG